MTPRTAARIGIACWLVILADQCALRIVNRRGHS